MLLLWFDTVISDVYVSCINSAVTVYSSHFIADFIYIQAILMLLFPNIMD